MPSPSGPEGSATPTGGLTPLVTVNMKIYGEIQLNLDRRLNLATDGGVAGD